MRDRRPSLQVLEREEVRDHIERLSDAAAEVAALLGLPIPIVATRAEAEPAWR